MRMSCNGCRILRKGCSTNCIIRPCLHWIRSPESQANATLFLAKFYGRAGLINLIEASPEHFRPATFRSLLYEACGRVVNPMMGSAGLLWCGDWNQCQAAVEAVLNGLPIMQSPAAFSSPVAPLRTHDIRHVSKDSNSGEISKVKTRTRFKRSAPRTKSLVPSTSTGIHSHGTLLAQIERPDNKKENENLFSTGTVEGSLLDRTKPQPVMIFDNQDEGGDVGLNLTLCLAPPSRAVLELKENFGGCQIPEI
ncbi:hypothetical protein SLE2022_218790 [Rubroshorea leprosula]